MITAFYFFQYVCTKNYYFGLYWHINILVGIFYTRSLPQLGFIKTVLSRVIENIPTYLPTHLHFTYLPLIVGLAFVMFVFLTHST